MLAPVRRTAVRLGLCAALAALAALPGRAAAQAGDVNINPFRPAIDSRGYITVNASQVLGHKDVSIGILMDGAYKLLDFDDGTENFTVQYLVTPTLVLAGGLKPENVRAAVEAVQPFGLDLCSGVRTGGRLDPYKLERFFAALA